MQKLFIYNQSTQTLDINAPEVLRIKEFQKLFTNDKSPLKKLLTKQLTYIQLALAWDSPYSQYNEHERHEAALSDSELTEKEFNDPDFRAACRKYRELQDSNKSIRMLESARCAVDQLIDYFENIVNLNERDANGKPVFSAEKMIKEVSMLNKVHQELIDLEHRVKKELTEVSQIRAGAVEGFEDFDDFDDEE